MPGVGIDGEGLEALEVYASPIGHQPVEDLPTDDRPLGEMVPEYGSRNPFVKWVFRERLRIGFSFIKMINPTPQGILDAGCGDGRFFQLFPENWPGELWGLDKHPNVEELSLRYPQCTFKRSDLTKIELPHHSFDVITCFDVLEHILDVGTVLRGFRNVLVSEGHLVVSLPTENAFYKSMRCLVKGSFSGKIGPCSGPHYHNAKQAESWITSFGFKEVIKTEIPYQSPFDLFQIRMYRSLKS